MGTEPRSLGPCIEWTGRRTAAGYGRVRQHYAHRVAYAMYHGPIPDGMEVMHRCDNPGCVNPEHLCLGSHSDNMADMARKGRQSRGARHGASVRAGLPGPAAMSAAMKVRAARGERQHCARLTSAQVTEIRARYAAGGCSWSQLAREYGVATATIQDVLQRKTWRHVP